MILLGHYCTLTSLHHFVHAITDCAGKTETIMGLASIVLADACPTPPAYISYAPGAAAASSAQRPRLLLCAPSNTAADELGHRLLQGIISIKGQNFSEY
jgi:AAA domain